MASVGTLSRAANNSQLCVDFWQSTAMGRDDDRKVQRVSSSRTLAQACTPSGAMYVLVSATQATKSSWRKST